MTDPIPRRDRLDLSRYVPIALFLLAHTGTLIWFLASTSTSLQYLARQVEVLGAQVTTIHDADARLGVLSSRLEDLSRRIENLEGRR